MRFEFWNDAQQGEQWGVGFHDLDGNGFLDLYANHHIDPSREFIFNFATDDPRHERLRLPGDLHTATFFDIDQDGDADLLQGTGARRGTVTDPENETFWNKINLNLGDGVFDPQNSVARFGLEYGLGSGRMMIPVNFDGQIAIYMGVRNARADGLNPGEFFRLEADGRYAPFRPLGDEVSGELAKGVHFGEDRFTDIINFDQANRELRVFVNDGSGFGSKELISESGGSWVYDFDVGDFDGDLLPEVLLARANDFLLKRNADGGWDAISEVTGPMKPRPSASISLGDFDNDGNLDYASLQRIDAGLDVIVFRNRGDGTFEVGTRYTDLEVAGAGEYVQAGDFNRDGALDLLVTTSWGGGAAGEYMQLLGEAGENNWLSIALKGVVSETGGIGARVYVTTEDGKTRMLEQDGKAHFHVNDAPDLHFGLAGHETADVRIVWADGYEQRVSGLAANQHLVIEEDRSGPEPGLSLRGTSEAETLRGASGDDRLSGGRGDDTLLGFRGDDRLFGGRGDDVLDGGLGHDQMKGGPGEDVFVFAALGHSVRGAARDIIRDFERGEDRIDLSRIDADATAGGDQGFDFIGDARFDGIAGQLRYNGKFLSADVDGDRQIDFQLKLLDVPDLSGGDIML